MGEDWELPAEVAALPETLTIGQVAALIKMTPINLRRLIREHGFPADRSPSGRYFRFDRDRLWAWLKALPLVGADGEAS